MEKENSKKKMEKHSVEFGTTGFL